MNTQQRTLGSVINQTSQQQRSQSGIEQDNSFLGFMIAYSVNLALRYPDVTDLNLITHENVRRVADFSRACTTIGLESWREETSQQDSRQRQHAA